MANTTIPVGQALLILIDHYWSSQLPILNELIELYVLGASTTDVRTRIADLLAEHKALLSSYIISCDAYTINEDPVRRYFETHWAYETLKNYPMRHIDVKKLKKHYAFLEALLPESSDSGLEVTSTLLADIFSGNFKNVKRDLQNAQQYYEAVVDLQSQDYYQEFSEEDREKMILIAKSNFLSISIPNATLPINIYEEGYYASLNRGKAPKDHESRLPSFHRGIMKTYMPVPRNDIATSESISRYQDSRVADRQNYSHHSIWAAEHFSWLVHPFSCSISGTMLLHLRVSKYLMNNNNFLFDDVASFRQYLKVLVPLMIYNSGGHSFQELMFPLSLKKMRENFSCMPGFADISIKTLFVDGNETALNKALSNTIGYHKIMLTKYKAHDAIRSGASSSLLSIESPLKYCYWINALDKEITTLMTNMSLRCCYKTVQIKALEQIKHLLLSAKPDAQEEQTAFYRIILSICAVSNNLLFNLFQRSSSYHDFQHFLKTQNTASITALKLTNQQLYALTTMQTSTEIVAFLHGISSSEQPNRACSAYC